MTFRRYLLGYFQWNGPWKHSERKEVSEYSDELWPSEYSEKPMPSEYSEEVYPSGYSEELRPSEYSEEGNCSFGYILLISSPSFARSASSLLPIPPLDPPSFAPTQLFGHLCPSTGPTLLDQHRFREDSPERSSGEKGEIAGEEGEEPERKKR
ncbi:hypothetical protein DY000_02029506 [Brassica cretica]|uniref:Uncharacterized protein n=1 Tax=Brassica cretica TaxID=69181 RepID=A0ABQ7DPH6_BRACR|nr:hypothetical protein DY000_02029506 [Brassica cretica]